MMKPKLSLMVAAAVAAALPLQTLAASTPVVTDNRIINDDLRMSVLEAKIASLRKQVELLEDVKAIERLQQAYGYYVSEGMGAEAAALFSDSPTATIEVGQQGVYRGRERIRQFLTLGGEGLKDGEIREHLMFQGVVHVAPDGKTAKGRWRAVVMAGIYGQDGVWEEGPFENEYVKENGVWKFSKVHWFTSFIGSYDQGWHKKQLPMPGPSKELPPDQPPTVEYKAFPEFFLPPFHYLHPVTNKPVVAE
jgi:hypothetical protein